MTNQWQIAVPGRVNLIGEHIDYHNLPVLPMAIQRHIVLEGAGVSDTRVQVTSEGFGAREVCLTEDQSPGAAGDWGNYLKAAIQAVRTRWAIRHGFRAHVTSDLPAAAGLSSSTALLTAFSLALLRANRIQPGFDELMSVLPEGEHFVGTRGGGMDHAAVLAARAGQALLVRFAPFGVEYVPVPSGWRFLVAHSLTRAEKSGAAKARYNACRTAGLSALSKLGLAGFQPVEVKRLAALEETERDAFRHVSEEAERVMQAVTALKSVDMLSFGELLNASHASLRDLLKVSCPGLDRVVEIAIASGAAGARLTGAGFGGCAIILSREVEQQRIIAALENDFYSAHPEYNRSEHLIRVQPSNGALYASD